MLLMRYTKILIITALCCYAWGNTPFQAKDFTHLIGKTPGLSKDLLTLHLSLYNGYVKNTNALIEKIDQLERAGQSRSLEYGALKRRFGFEYDGMVLHELYFGNLGFSQKLSAKDPLYHQIAKDFGSYGAFMKEFVDTGMIRGIGWVILYRDPKDGHLFTVWINEHQTNHLVHGTPILVMDVWEHAYLTEYGLDREAYIRAFFNNVDWSVCAARFAKSGGLHFLANRQ